MVKNLIKKKIKKLKQKLHDLLKWNGNIIEHDICLIDQQSCKYNTNTKKKGFIFFNNKKILYNSVLILVLTISVLQVKNESDSSDV